MKLGIAADHGGYELKGIVQAFLNSLGHETIDFGAFELNTKDDYPDFVIPLARAVAEKKADRGIAICGSGVGAAIVANKIVIVPGLQLFSYHFRIFVSTNEINIIRM